MGRYPKRCYVPGCTDKQSTRHSMPANKDVRAIWLQRINNPELTPGSSALENARICGIHFEEICRDPRGKLMKMVLPTLHLPDYKKDVDDRIFLRYQEPSRLVPEYLKASITTLSVSNAKSVDNSPVGPVQKPVRTYTRERLLEAYQKDDPSTSSFLHKQPCMSDLLKVSSTLGHLIKPEKTFTITGHPIVELDTQHEVCSFEDNDVESQHADADEDENITIVMESSESIKTCRVCMRQVTNDAKNIFKDYLYDEMPIYLGIAVCIYPIEVSIEDPLTKYACSDCLEQLSSFVKFRNAVIRNDKIQRERIVGTLTNEESISLKRKIEVDNESHQAKKTMKINGLERDELTSEFTTFLSNNQSPYPTEGMPLAVVRTEEGTVIAELEVEQPNDEKSNILIAENKLSNANLDSMLQVNNSSLNTDINISFCMVDGYLMEHKFSKENTRYVKCALAKCPALGKQEILLPGLVRNQVSLIKPHNHEKPTDIELKKQKIISVVRKKLQITKGSTVKSIYDDISKLDPAVAELLPMKALMTEICNL